MARIVIIPGAIRSKLITTMEFASRLQQAGHEVTPVAPAAPEVEQAGIDCLQSNLRLELKPPFEPTREGRVRQCQAVVSDADVAGFEQQLSDLNPDLVIIDIEAHPHIMVAIKNGYRVALLCVFFNLLKYPNVPPVHLPIMPGRGVSGTRPGIEFAWWRYRFWRWRELRSSRRHGADHLALHEAFARRIGFSLKDQVDYYQGLLPFYYRHVPVINTNMLELELPLTPVDQCQYVGPMTSTNREKFAFSCEEQKVADEIDQVALKIRQRGGEHKLIYCGFGSYYFGDDSDFLKRVIEAVGQHPEWTAILGLGGRIVAQNLPELPANVYAFEWAPQMQALARADLAMIHGGMTTVYECIHHEVPMLVYPYTDSFDQFGTAARTEYRGLGLVGDRKRDRPEDIAAHIKQVLADRDMKERVGVARQQMQRYISDNRLGIAIDNILYQLNQ